MGINKTQLIFDQSEPDTTDNVGAFVRSSDGTLITHTTDGSKKRLDTDTGLDTDIANIVTLLSNPLDINLPNGIATEAKQDIAISSLSSIDSKIVVANIRERILKSEDRESYLTYSDFGTKNQRITRIDYSTSTIPTNVVSKVITYTLVGNKYKRDSINWIIT